MEIQSSYINIEEYEIELKIKMSVAQWRVITNNINTQAFLATQFKNGIVDAVKKIEEKVLIKPDKAV